MNNSRSAKPPRPPLVVLLRILIILAVCIPIIWFMVSNLLGKKTPSRQSNTVVTPTLGLFPATPSSIPEKITLPDKSHTIVNYLVKDNKIYWVDSRQEVGVLMDINSFPAEAEIISIESVDLSPDKSQLLIKAFPGYGLGSLFTSSLTGKNLTQITISSQEEVWSPSGKYIAYTRLPSDIGPAMVFIYDTSTNKHINFDVTHKTFCSTSYSNLNWTNDEKAIIAHYQGTDCSNSPQGRILGEGQTKLYLK